jgi:omega-6 fatty acid desaturase (delta-12 desaturase)
MAALTELQSPVTTSLTLVDMRRCLRLKLWNPETRSLVTFNGM